MQEEEEDGWSSGSARLCLRLQILLTGLAAMFLLLNMIHIWGMVSRCVAFSHFLCFGEEAAGAKKAQIKDHTVQASL